jgi:glycosyltransferase involved in cell wall biosynthesis
MNMILPKISIVTPNYNGAKYLEETILSVLNQNYPNLEYIIIDGGSTDDSIKIIEKYEKKLSFWVSEKDNGIYDALNKGFKKSTGQIMGWINSDDLLIPKSLYTIAEIFSLKGVHWLQGNPSLIDKSGRITNCSTITKWSKFDFHLGNYRWVQQESTYWTRDLWEKSGSFIDTSLIYAADFELWLRFFQFEKMYVTTAPIGSFRQHSNSQISQKYFVDYVSEVLERQKIIEMSPKEKKLIKSYLLIEIFQNFINKLKLFKADYLTNNFRETKFGYPPIIAYDSNTQKFIFEEFSTIPFRYPTDKKFH